MGIIFSLLLIKALYLFVIFFNLNLSAPGGKF
jgi:hypothetical protein